MIPKVLTVAGSDPSGGAGIQQDLRVFSQMGCYGMAAVAALTVQNSTGVKRFVPVDTVLLREQLDFLLEDVLPHAAKTGMLGNAENIQVVAESLGDSPFLLVVDPVLVSTSGDTLFSGVKEVFLEALLPIATVVAPNVHEASSLSGIDVRDLETMKEAACRIKEHGPGWVLIKGGDLEGDEVVDLLHDGSDFHFSMHPRISLPAESHGTGCALSSTLAAFLAQGFDVRSAYDRAFAHMELYLRGALPVGAGALSVNPLVIGDRERARGAVLARMGEAVEQLETLDEGGVLVPEVQMNLCEAVPMARDHGDVAGVKGRLVKFGNRIRAVGCPAFGASRHVANIVLTAMRFDPAFKAAMNIRYRSEWIPLLHSSPLEVASFSRAEEPPEIKMVEGSTLEWGVAEVCRSLGRVPSVIYDEGDVGKEPMVRVLGVDALDVVKKVRLILDLVAC
jgi:hydroxymethylpyrimidine/phosphomethylpyrimidine kinase